MIEKETPKLCSILQSRRSSCLYPISAKRSSSWTLLLELAISESRYTVPSLYLRAINEAKNTRFPLHQPSRYVQCGEGKMENKAIVTSGASTSYMHGRDSAIYTVRFKYNIISRSHQQRWRNWRFIGTPPRITRGLDLPGEWTFDG